MTALNKQAHQTENERMAQSLAERNGEPVEGLRQRISELEEIATDYGMKFQKAQDALKHQALLHQSQMEAAEKRIAEHNFENRLLDNADRDIKALRQRIAELEALRSGTQSVPLQLTTTVDGREWKLFCVNFKSDDAVHSAYFYAIDREHASYRLEDLKQTGELQWGNLLSTTG